VDAACRRSEFQSVGEDVREDLLEPARVGADDRGFLPYGDVQPNPLLFRSLRDRLHGGAQGSPHIERLEVQRCLASHDLVHVQEVLDEAGLEQGVALDHVRRPKRIPSGLQDVGPSEDRGERRPQFMGKHGQEVVFRDRRFLAEPNRFFIETDAMVLSQKRVSEDSQQLSDQHQAALRHWPFPA
jgi:hypothetical protein